MTQISIAITGGGSGAIGKYLENGGKSAFLVDAQVPYSMNGLDNYLGGKPDKYCSKETAAVMAMRALERSKRLGVGENEANCGIGVTASLTKDGERQGRKHVAYIGVHKDSSLWLYETEFTVGSRQAQEQVLADLICKIMNNEDESAPMCFSADFFENPNLNEAFLSYYYPSHRWQDKYVVDASEVYSGKRLYKHTRKEFFDKTDYSDSIILSSSFNPCHNTHIAMAKYARERWPEKKIFAELSINNFEKPKIDYLSLTQRINSIPLGVFDDLIISNRSTFVQKADVYTGCTFLMGDDTLIRIPRDDLTWILEESMNKIVCFPRELQDLENEYYYSHWNKNSSLIWVNDFERTNDSSRKIRQQA